MTGDRPRLWCVSELYFPEQGTASHLLTQTAEGLAADFDVHVLCGQPDYFESGNRSPARETRNNTRIFRVRGTRLKGNSLFFRLVNSLTFAIAIFFFALVNFRKNDHILAATNPPPLPIMIGLAGRLRRCKSTLLVHDVYPDVLAAANTLRRDSVAYHVLDAAFRVSYSMFDGFIVLGEDMKQVVQQKLVRVDHAISIIPNWADGDIEPIDRDLNPFRVMHGLVGKFVVQFSGNFGRTHDIELVLEAANQLAENRDIVFLFVGAGPKAHLVDGESGASNNVIFLPRQPRNVLCQMLAASDVTIISFVDGMLGLSVPSRMYNIMAAGVPIIASAHPASELAREINAASSGWVLERSGPNELADLIRTLSSSTGLQEAKLRGRNGRQAVQERYSARHAIKSYSKALR